MTNNLTLFQERNLNPKFEHENPLYITHNNREWLNNEDEPVRPDIASSVVIYECDGIVGVQSLIDGSEIAPKVLQAIRQQHPHLR